MTKRMEFDRNMSVLNLVAWKKTSTMPAAIGISCIWHVKSFCSKVYIKSWVAWGSSSAMLRGKIQLFSAKRSILSTFVCERVRKKNDVILLNKIFSKLYLVADVNNGVYQKDWIKILIAINMPMAAIFVIWHSETVYVESWLQLKIYPMYVFLTWETFCLIKRNGTNT